MHQLRHICIDQMRELLERNDKGCADELSPVGVPGIVDNGWISWGSYCRFFRVLLVVSIPVSDAIGRPVSQLL